MTESGITRVCSRLLLALCGVASTALVLANEHPGVDEFVERAVAEHGLDADELQQLVAAGEYKQSIIDAITRPAEAKPWYDYRKIFLTDARIQQGKEFWREHTELIDRVAAAYAIPPEVFLAIIGVETRYGRNTGSYRVLDALVTLGFYYPRRADFFSGELAEFVRLAQEEQVSALAAKGSYAGAMGLGQFIPSSYRAYAVDFDGDDRRDLWDSLPDAVASVANYLNVHKWQPGAAIAVPVNVADDSSLSEQLKHNKPELSIAQWRELGVETDASLDDTSKAMLIKLEGASGPEFWLGLQNFYVITRYNRSPLYAMAVLQLSQALREAYNES